MYIDTANVEPEMYDCTGNNWSHWSSDEKLKEKNLETVAGKHSIDSLQKTAILGTAHTIRKVLQCEAWSVSGGDHCWFNRSAGKKCLWQRHPYRIIIIIIIIIMLFLGRHYHSLPTDLTFSSTNQEALLRDFRLPSWSEADDNCALLGHSAASCGNFLPTFRDNPSVPSSGVKDPNGCPETSARSCHCSLRNNADQRGSHEAPHHVFFFLQSPVTSCLSGWSTSCSSLSSGTLTLSPPSTTHAAASNCQT